MSSIFRATPRSWGKPWRRILWLIVLAIASLLFTQVAIALVPQIESKTTTGIDALRLHRPPYNLLGRKIAIGQLEVGRPGELGWDKAVSGQKSVRLQRSFYRDQTAKANRNVDAHAFAVASVMISQNKVVPGVAPQAHLYSSATGVTRRNRQREDCLGAQILALQNGGDVRAVNLSFGESLRDDPRSLSAQLDGQALLTQCLDWLSQKHNVLFVVAGNQGKGGIPIPTDQYNGVTVAASTPVEGVYRKVDFGNISDPAPVFVARLQGKEYNLGSRRSVGLIAPGSHVSLLTMEERIYKESGTSFAAPHVTATVALLQEFSDRALRDRRPHWSVGGRRHEVMKAILLNAADKIQDRGDGRDLGMSRTVLTKQNKTWLDSDAAQSRQIPLDAQMGAGHLNAFRAITQLQAGQWQPTEPIPALGWNYGEFSQPAPTSPAETAVSSPYQDYLFQNPLKAGHALVATLAWDRVLELADRNQNDLYDVGETFRDRGLPNLNLYLMPAAETDTARSLWSSESAVDSVEHLFFKIPTTGQYKLRVAWKPQLRQAPVSNPIHYGLAWWTTP